MTADNIRAILTYAKDSGLNAEVFIKHDFLIFFDYPFVFEVGQYQIMIGLSAD